MKKQILACAVAAAFATGAVAAEVTIYGDVNTGFVYNYTKVGDDASTNRFTMESGISGASRWGVKGGEDLGNGYSVSFDLQSGFDSDTGKMKYDRLCYMIRSKAFKAYKEGRWNIHDLFELNIEKISDNNHCWYCGKELPMSQLTRDHVFPRSKGGCNDMDNIIMVCKSCNSSKGKMDLFEWYAEVRKENPPLNVLIHYLKNIYLYCVDNQIMETRLEDLEDLKLPFNWHYIPIKYPQPALYQQQL